MKKIVIIIGLLTALIIILILISQHADGAFKPKINVIVVDRDGNPISGASVLYLRSFEEVHVKKNLHNEYFKYVMEGFKKTGQYSITDAQGFAVVNAYFSFAAHYLLGQIKQINLHHKDGVLIVIKDNYKTGRTIISSRKYRDEIINKKTINIKITLEK